MVVSVQKHLPSPEPEVSDVTNFQEDTDGDPPDFIYNNSEESHGYDNFPQDIQKHSTEQNQITSGYSIDLEEIPELEEDWDNGQFADADTNLITRHNTHSESERIRREYTQHLLDLSDNQFYDEENPINQLQHSSPDPDYYRTPTRQSQKYPAIPTGIILHHPAQQMYNTGMHVAERNMLSYMGIDFSVRRLGHLKVGKPEREDTITGKE